MHDKESQISRDDDVKIKHIMQSEKVDKETEKGGMRQFAGRIQEDNEYFLPLF